MKYTNALGKAALLALAIASVVGMRLSAQAEKTSPEYDLSELKVVPPDDVPQYGTFWRLQRATAPLPFNSFEMIHTNIQVEVYRLPAGGFLIDDCDVDYSLLESSSSGTMFEFDGPEPESVVRNSEKFMAQTFSLLDTNAVAQTDTNLYNALLTFPPDTNAAANLQILPYGTNSVIIRANHFDYSAETERDFALVICNKVETPLWKNIDFFGTSDSQDGWLVQGLVARRKVTDPMYLMVSNLNSDYNGFFRAIPYGGPQIQLTGPQPYDVVSNTITLPATIIDLSGVSNAEFAVTVDGAPARYQFGANNTINLETKYNPNGIATVYLKAFTKPQVYAPTNLPDLTKLVYSGLGFLPLDFENDTYLAFASDYAPPEIGTNYILFSINKAQDIEARIFAPSNNQTLASFAGYVPFATTVALPWNFTLADGVTLTPTTPMPCISWRLTRRS